MSTAGTGTMHVEQVLEYNQDEDLSAAGIAAHWCEHNTPEDVLLQRRADCDVTVT